MRGGGGGGSISHCSWFHRLDRYTNISWEEVKPFISWVVLHSVVTAADRMNRVIIMDVTFLTIHHLTSLSLHLLSWTHIPACHHIWCLSAGASQWPDAVWFQVVRPSHSCKHDISCTSFGIFFKFGSYVCLRSIMDRWEFEEPPAEKHIWHKHSLELDDHMIHFAGIVSLVNVVSLERLQKTFSNLVQMFTLTQTWTDLIWIVKGQRSRSPWLHKTSLGLLNMIISKLPSFKFDQLSLGLKNDLIRFQWSWFNFIWKRLCCSAACWMMLFVLLLNKRRINWQKEAKSVSSASSPVFEKSLKSLIHSWIFFCEPEELLLLGRT